MDKVLNSYETLFVVDITAGDEAVNTTVDRFTTLIADNAEIVEIAKWGKRRLAYPINDMNEGYYVIVTFKSEPSFPTELERLLTIHESIMRSLTVRLGYDAAEKLKATKAAEAAAEAAREAAAKAAKEAAEKAAAEAAEAAAAAVEAPAEPAEESAASAE